MLLFVRERVFSEGGFLLGRMQTRWPCVRQRDGRRSHGWLWTIRMIHYGFYSHDFFFDLFYKWKERIDDRIQNSMSNPSWVNRKNETPLYRLSIPDDLRAVCAMV